MRISLITVALVTAMNPMRLAAVSPADPRLRFRTILAAAAGMVGVGVALAWWSSPLIASVDVSDPSTAIAAGLALVVIGLRDAILGPPGPEPEAAGMGAAIVPMFFPTLFTPPMAILSVAAGAERGVLVSASALLMAAAIVAGSAMLLTPELAQRHRFTTRSSASAIGLLGVVFGAIVATHGVMSI